MPDQPAGRQPPLSLAVFISPHGFGHAARLCAVLLALQRSRPALRVEAFTLVPEWFLADTLGASFRYHALLTDIGLVQRSSLDEDLPATAARLSRFLPFEPGAVAMLAEVVQTLGCRAVLCDIAPLGLAVARAARLPAVLIENFTWDFIYAGYTSLEPALTAAAELMRTAFALADLRIRTEPVCGEASADLTVPPVSRPPRTSRAEVRRRLGLPEHEPVVLVTMGGIAWNYAFADRLATRPDIAFVLPGGSDHPERRGNLVLLPHHSGLYHPDLVGAVDAVVGKVGYSTLAETYAAGVPFGYVARSRFPESPPLVEFIRARMPGLEVASATLVDGSWVTLLDRLLRLPRGPNNHANGADAVATHLLTTLSL